MKIAMIYDAVHPYIKGGVEKRIYDLANAMSKKHEVYVLGMKYWEGPRQIKMGNINYYGVCRPLKLYTKSGRRSLFEPLYFGINLLPALFRFDFDIIDCQNFPYFPCFAAKIYSLMKKKPLVMTWCEVWGDYWSRYLKVFGFFGRMTEKAVSMLTKNNISLSELTSKNLLSLGVRSEVIEPAIYLKDLSNAKKGKKGNKNENSKKVKKSFDVIFIGRFIREKNIDVLVRALNLTEANAVIIGDGPEKERISSLVNELGIASRIKMTGFLEEQQSLDYMSFSRIFVTLSEREGFGMAAAQAMALGMPVITINSRNNAVSSKVPEDFICRLSKHDVAEKINSLLKKGPAKIDYPKLKNNDAVKTAQLVEDYYAKIIFAKTEQR